LLAVKTKGDSSHQAVAPRQPLERANREDSTTNITFLAARNGVEDCSVIRKAGLMMCAVKHTPVFKNIS